MIKIFFFVRNLRIRFFMVWIGRLSLLGFESESMIFSIVMVDVMGVGVFVSILEICLVFGFFDKIVMIV